MAYCIAGTLPAEGSIPDPAAGLHSLYREQERRKRVLGWQHTHKYPFEGEWEQIMSWLVANPERSSGDIFRELQRLFPGRYQPLQIRTLQRGMRKIRAYLLETVEEHWQEEVIQGPFPSPVSATGYSLILSMLLPKESLETETVCGAHWSVVAPDTVTGWCGTHLTKSH